MEKVIRPDDFERVFKDMDLIKTATDISFRKVTIPCKVPSISEEESELDSSEEASDFDAESEESESLSYDTIPITSDSSSEEDSEDIDLTPAESGILNGSSIVNLCERVFTRPPLVPISATQKILPTSTPTTKTSIPDCAFGATKWATYFGVDVGEDPPLPSNINQILDSQCPIFNSFWNPFKKTIKETHMLVLISATINGRRFTIATLGELIREPKQGHATRFNCLELGSEYYKNVAEQKSHWVLMSRDIIDESRDQNCKTHRNQLFSLAHRISHFSDLGQMTHVQYTLPKVLEAATCILTHYVSTGQRLYPQRSSTFARCQEIEYNSDDYRTWYVGDSGRDGLCIYSHFAYVLGPNRGVGIAPCMRF